MVGMADRLGSRVEAGVEEAGGRLFCADGPLMQANGQAGRSSAGLASALTGGARSAHTQFRQERAAWYDGL